MIGEVEERVADVVFTPFDDVGIIGLAKRRSPQLGGATFMRLREMDMSCSD